MNVKDIEAAATTGAWPCATCGMQMPAGAAPYHPHLYCVIYTALHRDPEVVLREHGFTRQEGLHS